MPKGIKKLTERWKKNIALARMGLRPTKETLLKLSLSHKGQHSSPSTEFKKGHTPWIKGKKMGHPWNFQNYKSKEPYGRGWTNILKESIRLRDNYKCQDCGVPQEECRESLHVHHKNGVKTDLNPSNLISLCRSCHSKKTNRISKKMVTSKKEDL